ncbi:MAG: nuclear transport factor 2 family protein [Myxococcales bacterium]|jgi:hypothetical protein
MRIVAGAPSSIHPHRSLLAAALLGLIACRPPATQTRPRPMVAELDGTRWTFVDAECSDGDVELGHAGFEREIFLELREGGLRMTYETRLATEGCATTSVWQANVSVDGEYFRLDPQARVSMPAGRACGAEPESGTEGALRLSDDVLEVVELRSPWCRGFDVRFFYRRLPARRLSDDEVVRHYVAHFNRRDAEAVAGLFASSGSLVEPFTRTEDGNYARHEGREAVRGWFARSFESSDWSAMRLLSIQPGPDAGQLIARWQYMDPRLAQPLEGRNLFVLAAGEIFEAEVQLVGSPVPAVGGATRGDDGDESAGDGATP